MGEPWGSEALHAAMIVQAISDHDIDIDAVSKLPLIYPKEDEEEAQDDGQPASVPTDHIVRSFKLSGIPIIKG